MSRQPRYSDRTYIMGVLNVTPDSFYDKGKFFDQKKAVKRALDMEREGADIIDVGGESTRPGAVDVSVDEELKRVLPVIRAISKKVKAAISIDTRKAKVADAALKAGASIVNDVSALVADPKMAGVVAKHRAGIILMHMRGKPKDMQADPEYVDAVKDISGSLKKSIDLAKKSGIKDDKIIIDPGIGFGKTVEHNLQILRGFKSFKKLGYPICIGTSRKSFIGKILGCKDPEDRLAGSIATAAVAAMNGADIIRTHDVGITRQALKMVDSIINTNKRR
ncbi:MAG: dihydropteroate synthase [Candidatus Omnitrophica bacterium]|nr:dihydropteroate synthase [Candidatus Omnitrophota bacterium]